MEANCLPSKLRPPSQIPATRLYRSGSDVCLEGPLPQRAFAGRPVGSVVARAQAWERAPSGYLTIGSVRYGVRLASPSKEVVPSRGAAAKLAVDEDCCCGAVQSAWARAGASRIPLSPRAKNTAEAPVYRSALEVTRPTTLCDGDMKSAPPTPSSFGRRFLVRLGANSPPSQDGENSRLIPPDEPREEPASATSQMQSTLEKLQKFTFGAAGPSTDGRKRSGDKTEKLRELTDLLRGRPDRKKPPTPHSKGSRPSGLRSLFGSTTSLAAAGSSKENKGSHKRASSVTSVSPREEKGTQEERPRTTQSVDLQDEAAAVVAPSPPVPSPPPETPTPVPPNNNQQRPLANRSASFSQVDYSTSDGKYSWKRSSGGKGDPTKSMTFPRKIHVDASTSSSPPPEQLPEERTCSTASVDSAVGSDEGLGLSSTLDSTRILSGNRSQTFPLSSKKGVLFESNQSPPDGSLRGVLSNRDLPDVTEEAPLDSPPTDTTSPDKGGIENAPNRTNDDEFSPRSPQHYNESSHSQEILLPLENLGREIDEMLVQQSSDHSNKPEIFITTWPKSNNNNMKGKKKLTLNCSMDNGENYEDVKAEEKSFDADEMERNSTSPQRWSGGTDSSQSTRDCGSEPLSPEDLGSKPEWPKSRKLVCQSSEEREDYGPKRRFDSLSDGESDQADRSPSSGRRDGDRTCSPSPLFNPMFDLPENDRRKRTTHPPRRYSKRPLRGPYGQMLEAEMKMSQKNSDLTFLDEFIPVQLGSLPASPERPSSDPHLACPRPRSNTGTARSMDDSHLYANYPTNPKSPKRKISANIPYTESVASEVRHQRTTSSPSQLISSPTPEVPPAKGSNREPSQALLAELLKGSSERGFLQQDAVSLVGIENLKICKGAETAGMSATQDRMADGACVPTGRPRPVRPDALINPDSNIPRHSNLSHNPPLFVPLS